MRQCAAWRRPRLRAQRAAPASTRNKSLLIERLGPWGRIARLSLAFQLIIIVSAKRAAGQPGGTLGAPAATSRNHMASSKRPCFHLRRRRKRLLRKQANGGRREGDVSPDAGGWRASRADASLFRRASSKKLMTVQARPASGELWLTEIIWHARIQIESRKTVSSELLRSSPASGAVLSRRGSRRASSIAPIGR